MDPAWLIALPWATLAAATVAVPVAWLGRKLRARRSLDVSGFIAAAGLVGTRLAPGLLLGALILGCGSDAGPLLVITDVNVVPMSRDTTLVDQAVHISGGRIVAIGPMATATIPPNAQRLSAQGGFLIPGLWDMHVHVFGASLERELFPQLLAHGITGVRDMNGPVPLDSIQHLKDALADGRVRGPMLFAPGPLVDAPGRSTNELSPGIMEVANEEEARGAVRTLAEQGADFIKTYNRMTPSLLHALLDEAGEVGIPVAGHVPHTLPASSLTGLASQEHFQGILEESSAAGDSLRTFMGSEAAANPDAGAIARWVDLRTRMVHEYDERRSHQLIELFGDNGTALTPTLVSNRGVLLFDIDDSLRDDERFRGLDAGVREAWQQPNRQFALIADTTRSLWFDRLKSVLRQANDAGVLILAGTDLGVPWVYPGSSLHDELELFVDAGLSAYEALATATLNPAHFLGLDDHGRIDVGSVADLVIVNGNPTDDIGAVRAVTHVLRSGTVVYPAGGALPPSR